jgi:hypothetical protein
MLGKWTTSEGSGQAPVLRFTEVAFLCVQALGKSRIDVVHLAQAPQRMLVSP